MILNNRYFLWLILLIVNLCVLWGSYYYPVSRDEFYYLGKAYVNVFDEYRNAYQQGNPRIGQFFSNLFGRSTFLDAVFTILLFNAFLAVLYLTVFRRVPNFGKVESLQNYIITSAAFVLLINYFGEMFLYVPFSTNYTFLNVFYMTYVFVIWEYFYHQRELLKRIPFLLIALFGIFTGMGNEHVTPVLLLAFVFLGFIFLVQNKKLPSAKIILSALSLAVGYLLLFFAPANRIKFKTVGAEEFGFSFEKYLKGWKAIAQNYFYYNSELIIAFVVAATILFFIWKKKKASIDFFIKIVFLMMLAILVLFVAAYSPLIGTRILFFSNSLIIAVILMIFFKAIQLKFKPAFTGVSSVVLVVLMIMFCFITYSAYQNFNDVTTQIYRNRAKKDVVLPKSFDYRSSWAGRFNKKVLLDNGTEYIDDEPAKDNFAEHNLKSFFNLKSIAVKNGE